MLRANPANLEHPRGFEPLYLPYQRRVLAAERQVQLYQLSYGSGAEGQIRTDGVHVTSVAH